ncbi:branched-chain amino acid ABC transporter permease [Reyranella sp. CPCC 100927]|uniref:branched-chain amino acid ABC transporter permease n=1 Tax=Reyranella sp. CPCC 100927 TaxID=2599616 RepID=UPI0011B816E4|nr:branched-chain amino acid ABC transporter permease [Reyranella sp. CPCC 100927]TWT04007.1 branched-chain amino acid ABC transporter permease [Reyranella sp. CPCC 100927]
MTSRHWEWVFWIAAIAIPLLFPSKLLLINEIAILALFALSLDLLLGYAGIVSLGHAAFFGVGAYAAGLLAKHGLTEPVSGLLLASAAAAVIGFLSSFLVLRGSDLTRLMVTMGVALMLLEVANRFDTITGGADGLQGVTMGPLLGLFRFDLYGRTACAYSLTTLLVLFLVARRIVRSPFGLSLRAIKGNRLRATAVGVPADARLVTVYTIAAAYAGAAGALLAQTTQFVSLDVLDFHRSADVLLVLVLGGSGYLYGGLIGAAIFKLMQDGLAAWTPQYWQFWIGLVLVLIVMIGRERLSAGARRIWARLARQHAGEQPS